MSFLERIAAVEHRVRAMAHSLPSSVAVKLFSAGRTAFAKRYAHDVPSERFVPPAELGVTAWGLRFALPLWNAAGMFKKGEAYDVVSAQGAGGYVAGTTTSRVRTGNIRNGVQWPAIPYPHSHASSNWMGLPNEGHAVVAERLRSLRRVPGCPVGASVSAEPGLDETFATPELIEGMVRYSDAGVDYLELNESCPNVPGHGHEKLLDDELLHRLDSVASGFLAKRARPLPVVVKFSNDTNLAQLPMLIQVLIERGFDGIILGNTSTRYQQHRSGIADKDKALYDYFTNTYGGGLSGKILSSDSLNLCAAAADIVKQQGPTHEFHVVRCGGVSSVADILASRAAGVMLNQWYVGYFEAFAHDGHSVYRELSADLLRNSA